MGSWTKKDVVEALTARLGSREAATQAVEGFTGVVTRAVAQGDRVTLTGFGSFEPVARRARTGRNPRTGQSVQIPPRVSPVFRPGTAFKNLVGDPSLLPDDTPVAQGVAAAPRARAPRPEPDGATLPDPRPEKASAKKSGKAEGKGKKSKKGKKHKKS